MAKNKEKEKPGNEAAVADREIDALFGLPLSEFTSARNALAGKLKAAGETEEAEQVKALGKPSVSAWAVNQLYWKHREAFDRLRASGERFRQAQVELLSGKGGGVQRPQEERREAVSRLVRLAAGVLERAGHGATPDTIRRITTTLEALSVQASQPNASQLGRLIEDVDPPGFEALAGLMLTPIKVDGLHAPAPVIPIRPKREDHEARIAAAKLAVREVKSAVSAAREKVEEAGTALRKSRAEAATALQQMREAQARWEKARDASEAADEKVRSKTAEADSAAKLLAESEREFEQKSKELESLLVKG